MSGRPARVTGHDCPNIEILLPGRARPSTQWPSQTQDVVLISHNLLPALVCNVLFKTFTEGGQGESEQEEGRKDREKGKEGGGQGRRALGRGGEREREGE